MVSDSLAHWGITFGLAILADQRDRYPHRAEHGIALPAAAEFSRNVFSPAIMGNKPAHRRNAEYRRR